MTSQNKGHHLRGEHEYDGLLFPDNYLPTVLDRVKYEFQLRDDDVMIATYPKSGTAWFMEIIWLLMNEADVSKAKSLKQNIRVPFLERATITEQLNIDILEKAKSPRIFKTHLPFRFFSKQLTTKKTKIILGARNIKDTLVSFYHFYRMNECMGNMTGPFDEFFELFKDKHLAFGDWFDFYLEYWNNRHDLNLVVLKYEDLHKDFVGTVKKLSIFLGKEMPEAHLGAIEKHVAFDAMKDNESVNQSHGLFMKNEISPFLRKGKVGDWKNSLTVAQSDYIDALYKDKMLGTGLTFNFEPVQAFLH